MLNRCKKNASISFFLAFFVKKDPYISAAAAWILIKHYPNKIMKKK